MSQYLSSVTLSNQSPEPNLRQKEYLNQGEVSPTQTDSPSSEEGVSMAEYYQLQKMLLLVTVALIGIIFFPVWYFYSLNTALNYLLGAGVGLLYLRLLAKEVERLGQPNQRLGTKGLGIFVILIIVASRWQQLHILPVFLGFLTYKAAIVFYTLQITLLPAKKTPDNP
ncbi:MAG: ATP synthase subunit I [Pleurocapsa sp.]